MWRFTEMYRTLRSKLECLCASRGRHPARRRARIPARAAASSILCKWIGSWFSSPLHSPDRLCPLRLPPPSMASQHIDSHALHPLTPLLGFTLLPCAAHHSKPLSSTAIPSPPSLPTRRGEDVNVCEWKRVNAQNYVPSPSAHPSFPGCPLLPFYSLYSLSPILPPEAARWGGRDVHACE